MNRIALGWAWVLLMGITIDGCGGSSGGTDVTNCMDLLRASNIRGAAACFDAASGPQASFGSGLTHLILWPAEPSMQGILTTFKQPAWDPATKLFGPGGWFDRQSKTWAGTISLTKGGQAIALDRVRIGSSGGVVTPPAVAGLSIIGRSSTDPYLYLDLEVPVNAPLGMPVPIGGTTTYALLDLSQTTASIVMGGQVTFSALGQNPGDHVTASLDLVLQDGSHITGMLDDTISPCTDPYAELPFQTSLQGSAFVGADSSASFATFMNGFVGTLGYLDHVAAWLESAAQAPQFQFVIPAGMFFGARDVVIHAPEAHMLASGVRILKFGIEFLAAYDWNITRADIVRGTAVDEQALASALNQHFMNLTSAASLAQSKSDFVAAASSLKAAFDAIGTTPAGPGAFFDGSVLSGPPLDFLRSLATMLTQIPAGTVTLPNSTPPQQMDWSGIFGAHPLDANQVDTNPFDYSMTSTTTTFAWVELFWRQLLTGRMSPDFVGMSLQAPLFPTPDPLAGTVSAMPSDTKAQLQLFTSDRRLGCP
jgi:hypothetical protein